MINNIDNTEVLKMANIEELQVLLGIGKNTAYNLCRRKDFPSIKLCGVYKVLLNELPVWLLKQQKNK